MSSNLVRVIQFNKKLDAEILVDALDDMHVRHPMLSSKIMRAPIVGGAFRNSDSDIPLVTVTEAATDSTIARLVETELNTGIQDDGTIRVTLVQSEAADAPSALIITLNHAGSDAASASNLSKELLDRYLLLEAHDLEERTRSEKGEVVTLKEPEIEILPEIGSIDAFLPWTTRIASSFTQLGSIMTKETDKTKYAPHVFQLEVPPIPAGQTGKLSGVKCLNVHVQTPAEPILKACKKEGVKVSSAFVAALSLAIKGAMSAEASPQFSLVVQTGIDLRKQFSPPIDPKYIMPMAGVTHNVLPINDDLWDLAEEFEKKEAESIKENEPFVLPNYLLATNSTFGDTASRRPGAALTVSNYGRVDLPASIMEQVQVNSVADFKSNKLPQLQVIINTFGDLMNITVSFPDTPGMQYGAVEQIVHNALDRIVLGEKDD